MCIEYNECHYGGMYNVYVKRKNFFLLQKLCISMQVSALRKKRLKSL